MESFFGHLKAENPHLEKITDPGVLESELNRLQVHYNTIRLHEGVGYVTPEDEHYGRGEAIGAARRAGLANAQGYSNCHTTKNPERSIMSSPLAGSGIKPAHWCIISEHTSSSVVFRRLLFAGLVPFWGG